jgi:hypothetical protein
MINRVLRRRYFFLFTIMLVALVLPAHGQNKVGDNPTIIQPGSLLELESKTKGLRLPRIQLDDIHVWTLDGTPVSGMVIVNETGAAAKGIYYWSTDMSQWVKVLNAADLATVIGGNTTVSNTSTGNTLTTTVNGVTGLEVPIINSNVLSVVNGQLTFTVNGVLSSPPVNVLSSADNGLSATNGNVQLGGTLTQPATVSASAENTLAITGLQEGDISTDSILVVTPIVGVVKKVKFSSSGVNQYKSVTLATAGQLIFSTPISITDIKKIQVYRNGVSVECTAVDSNHIQLESEAACYANDEIKIIQLL